LKQFWTKGKKAGRRGFTLIEVLVTVAVIGVLVAVTIPAVTSQINAADPARILSDLGNITSGIDAFSINVRPSMPGDVEDLANAVSSTGDLDGGTTISAGVAYGTSYTKWKGPYIEKPVVENFSSAAGNAFSSGYSSFVQNDFVRCNSKVAFQGCSLTLPPDYLVVQIAPLTEAEFELVNKLIDTQESAGPSTSQSLGKLRYKAASSTAYYYATPLIQ